MSYADLITQQDAGRYFATAETGGSIATDMTGNANGTYGGSPAFQQAGPFVGWDAITMDGASDYIDCGDMSGIAPSFGTGATFSAWVKSSVTGTRMDLLGSLSSTVDIQVRVNHNGTGVSAGRLYITNKDSDQQNRTGSVDADTGLTDGDWHHIAIVFSRNLILVYIDGVQQGTSTVFAQNADNFAGTLPTDMYVGATSNNGTDINNWDGSLSRIAWFPWALSKAAISQLAGDNDALTASPTTSTAYQIDDDQIGEHCTRHAVDVAIASNGRYGLGAVVEATDTGDTLTFKLGDTTTARTISVGNLASRTGDYAENGTVEDVTAGTRTFTVEAGSGVDRLYGVILRTPDSASGTVLELGGATHCSPHAAHHAGVTTVTGVELYTGNRWAWQPGSAAVKVFDGIAADIEERYHNGFAVVNHASGLVFISVGHNQPYLRIKTAPAGDLSSLSAETQLLGASSELTYVHADVDDSGNVWVLTRDQDGVDGSLAVKITDVFSSPAATSDYLMRGINVYPRSLKCIGNNVYVALQNRPIGDAWKEWYTAWFDSAAGTWKSIDGSSTSGGSLGTLSAARFETRSDIEVLADATPGGRQKYLLAAAFDHDGVNPTVAAITADTATNDVSVYADTTYKLVGITGSTATETALPGHPTANSYRGSAGIIQSGDKLIIMAEDRGSYAPVESYDDDELYYQGWGSEAFRKYEATDAYGSSPAITAKTAPTISGDLAGWITPVDGLDAFSYQDGYDGLHGTRDSASVALYAIPNTSNRLIETIGMGFGMGSG